MKKFPLLILLLVASLLSFSQNKFGIDTTFLVGKESKIYTYRDIKVDKNFNKYVVGLFKGNITIGSFSLSTLPSITNNALESAQGSFIAKYDSNNNLLWAKKIAEADTLFETKLFIDNTNRLVVTNHFLSKLYFESDSLITQSGNSNFNIFLYDPNGVLISNKVIPGICGIISFAFTQDNSIFISGAFGADTSLNYQYILGLDTLHAIRGDGFISKLDSNYNFIWSKPFGGIGTDGTSHIQYHNNYLYLMGIFDASSNNKIGGITVNYPFYTSKWFIAKLDSQGNGLWVRKFGTTESLQFVHGSAFRVSNNRVYFSGHSFSNSQNVFIFDGGPTLTGTNQGDYFIASYDTNGAFKWNTISQSYGSEFLSALTTDTMGNLYGVGAINYITNFPTDTLYSYGGDDVMVCSYDSNGVYRWAFHAGGSGADIGSAIASDANGVLYIAGGTTSTECYMGNDTLYPPSGQSTFFYARLDSIPIVAPLSVSHTAKELQSITLYPNPSHGEVTLHCNQPTTEKAMVTISNTLGQQVYQVQMPANTTIMTLDVSKFSEGIYSIQFQTSAYQKSHKLVVNK